MKNKSFFSKLIVKRKIISLLLALLFWFICAYLASSWSGDDFWWSALMWNIVFNRFLIGVLVTFWGFMTLCPATGMRLYPFLRWAIIWAFVSIDISFWPFMAEMKDAWMIAFMTILAWAVYGMIIDIVATKFSWEWEKLFKSIK